MTDPRRDREDQSGGFRYWDGEKWQERTAPPRPRHPDFPPPAKPAPPPKQHTNPSTKRLALVVASTLSVLGTAIGLKFLRYIGCGRPRRSRPARVAL